jgi:hypothetical protein
MNGRGPIRDEPGEADEFEDLPVRDRPYESFGQQGFAMPTYPVDPVPHRGEVDFPVGEPIRPPPRTNERVRDEVCERLTDDAHVDASDVEVVVHDGEVILSGTVADRDQRWRAEDVTAHVHGVIDVVNRIRVRR